MITKERLQELIKQGATIYDIFKGDIYLVDLTMAKYYDVPKYIEYKNDYYNCNLTRSINDLFETEEEVEFYIEFRNIKRTETLCLPTWEEKDMFFEFTDIKGNDIHLTICYGNILIQYYNKDNILTKEYFNKPATKENYIEACRVCKKLFLGE